MSFTNIILFQNKQAVEQALEHGIDLDEYDEYGYTPLIEAIIANKTDIVELLLRRGANANSRDTTSRTPLHWAVDINNPKIVELLLKRDANINAYTYFSMPVATLPWLRGQKDMLDFLRNNGADLNFVKDYVYTKLLAHRYQLKTKIDIVSTSDRFIEINLEGFILESTVSIIHQSLNEFIQHFSARDFRSILCKAKRFLCSIENTQQLLKMQHFSKKRKRDKKIIQRFLSQDILFLPIAYTGHAIAVLKVGNMLAICDRGVYGKEHGTLVIYRIQKPKEFNAQLLEHMFFEFTSEKFIRKNVQHILGLKEMIQLPLAPQLTGNCSWANVEGIIPAAMFLLLSQDSRYSLDSCKTIAMDFFHAWQQFDKTRALDEMIDSFFSASPARKASIAALMACILFQCCNFEKNDDLYVAEKIARIFKDNTYHYVLNAYLKVHFNHHHNQSGKNFHELLEMVGVDVVV